MRPAASASPASRVPTDAGGQTPITIPRGTYVGVSLFALLLGAAAIVRGTRAVVSPQDSDLTTFFFPAANEILHGHPWMIYAVRAFGTYPLGYPNYNPPISIFLMAPLLAVAHATGIDANLGALISFVSIPFMLFVLALGYATIRALRQLFPAIPETQRFLAYLLIIFSPLTWQTFITWYHLEQPLMLALLVGAIVAFQARREGVAGVLAGLAVLSRTTAIVPLVAFGVLLLAGREWRALIRFGGLAALVAGVGFAPFFLFDRADTTYSLVSWRGTSEIGGNSIWSILRYDGTAAASHLRYTIDHVARRLDMYTVVVFVIIVALLAVNRLRISAYSREAWAILAIAALAVPMLSKNNWPYYYLEPFVFILIWEFASMHDRRSGVWRWPVLTFSYLSIAATLSQFIGLQSVGYLDRVAVGLVDFATMLAFALAVWWRARASRPETIAAPAIGYSSRPRAAAPGVAPGAAAGAPIDHALPAQPPRAPQSPAGAHPGRGPEGPPAFGQPAAWPGAPSAPRPGPEWGAPSPGSPAAPPTPTGPWQDRGQPPQSQAAPPPSGWAAAPPSGATRPAAPSWTARDNQSPDAPSASSGQWAGGPQPTPPGPYPPDRDRR